MNEDIQLLLRQICRAHTHNTGGWQQKDRSRKRGPLNKPEQSALCVYRIGKRGCPLSVNLVVCVCFYNVSYF